MPSILSGVITPCSVLYRSPTIFIYNLDLERCKPSIESELTLLMFFKKFSVVAKLNTFASLFIVMMILLLVKQMKSATIFNLEFFKHLLMLEMWICTELMINSVLDLAIGIITSFLDGPLVVMLILDFFLPSLLFFTFNIFSTSFTDKAENASLTHKTSSMLGEIFNFKT